MTKELPEIKQKKPVVLFTVADKNNVRYAIPFLNSLRKFHDIPVILYTDETNPEKLPKISNLQVVDLTPYLTDRMFFYRQKPILAEPLLDEYELVLGADCDQLILGDLNYILETKDYDIGTVLNANRFDYQFFGWVDLGRIGIAPIEYFNCGFVAMRNKKFVHQWLVNCLSPQFDRMQFKEQDILNILCYFGNYNIRCFDHGDGIKNYSAWHGLIGKSEWWRAIVKDGKIIVPKGLGDTPYPPADMEIKIAHLGGGAGMPKDNWGAYFSQDAMKVIDELIK